MQLLEIYKTKWLQSFTVCETLKILREAKQIGNCAVTRKCYVHLDWRKKIFLYKVVVVSRPFVGKIKIYIGERKVSFILKWEAVVWLCGAKQNAWGEGIRNCERNWNTRIHHKPRFTAEVSQMKWFLCKAENKYCTKVPMHTKKKC